MNLTTTFLSVQFENPFVLASGPPTANYEMIARAFEAGWAGAVTKTLISEPVQNLRNRFAVVKNNSRIIAFKNIELLSEHDPYRWFSDIRKLKLNYPDKVVIGSIMGDAVSEKQWLFLAQGCQDAGADMIELNFSCPHGYPERGIGSAIGQSADFSSNIVRWLKAHASLNIPIIPKLTSAVSDISFIGQAVCDAGADGICAINTFPSLMGFDLKALTPKDSIGGYTTAGGFSGIALKPIALRCVSDLCKSPGLPVMACGGISTGFDAVEFILLGAPVIQVCTQVMLEGFEIVDSMKLQLTEFMNWHKFDKIDDFLGLGNRMIKQHSELNPKFNVVAKVDADICNGCRSCFTSCMDGGFQAIVMENDLAVILAEKCTGCSLCSHVCPTNAIEMIEI